jgi:ribosomal protein S12 methylthiotransferase
MQIKVKTFAIISLGCPKNTVDSEILKGGLERQNFRYLTDPTQAETVIINTCGFIEPAREESIDTILETLNLKETGVRNVIVMGCLAERYGAELAREIPEADWIIGVNSQSEIIRRLSTQSDFCSHPETDRQLLTPNHYAYLKIAEGCDNSCSFCSIPFIRGKHVSRNFESLFEEARYLHNQGVQELILIAQDLTRYGTDLSDRRRLTEFVRELLKLEYFPWVRLMYTNPTFWDHDLNSLFRKYPALCPYIDIPVQHAADNILKSMNRGITQQKMRILLGKIRREIPRVVLRTSVLVGYPGEGEKEFGQLLDFIEEQRFERLGVFTYSEEAGTEAAYLPNNITDEEKEERRERIMELQWQISADFAARQLGKTIAVIIDEKNAEGYLGRSVWDAPEVDCTVKVRSENSLIVGRIFPLKIIATTGIDLIAEPVVQ